MERTRGRLRASAAGLGRTQRRSRAALRPGRVGALPARLWLRPSPAPRTSSSRPRALRPPTESLSSARAGSGFSRLRIPPTPPLFPARPRFLGCPQPSSQGVAAAIKTNTPRALGNGVSRALGSRSRAPPLPPAAPTAPRAPAPPRASRGLVPLRVSVARWSAYPDSP